MAVFGVTLKKSGGAYKIRRSRYWTTKEFLKFWFRALKIAAMFRKERQFYFVTPGECFEVISNTLIWNHRLSNEEVFKKVYNEIDDIEERSVHHAITGE